MNSNILKSPALVSAKKSIEEGTYRVNKDGRVVIGFYEHTVGTWACTALSRFFNGEQWLITPEKTDSHSKKRPDLVVERIEDDEKLNYHLLMELKSATGDRFEDALDQLMTGVEDTLEDVIDVYMVVQKGMKIGFFEFHNDIDPSKSEIQHFDKCISITQGYKNNPAPFNPPAGTEKLFYNTSRLRKTTSVRTEASGYDIPCVFDLTEHETEISDIFDHMVNNPPRPSPKELEDSG